MNKAAANAHTKMCKRKRLGAKTENEMNSNKNSHAVYY